MAYLDPGNWATAVESGSRFGYEQLWVLVLANVIAIGLQTLAARLGLVTGKHLAQVCRDSYPPVVCKLLWIMNEISIVALDLTMVLGATRWQLERTTHTHCLAHLPAVLWLPLRPLLLERRGQMRSIMPCSSVARAGARPGSDNGFDRTAWHVYGSVQICEGV